jgi:hypothetical protein
MRGVDFFDNLTISPEIARLFTVIKDNLRVKHLLIREYVGCDVANLIIASLFK